MHTGHDQCVASSATHEIRHTPRQTDGGDQSGSLD
jgi:hypothetical protein